jgi:SAM-dependent methyltransferase
MRSKELEDFYQEGYRSLYQETEEPTKKDLIMQEERARRTLEMIKQDVPRIKRHLDIGSSSGALLGEFKEYFGCESVGVEPGDEYRTFSTREGYFTYPSLETLPIDSERFDMISLMHVLEHFSDPIEQLQRLRENHLSQNGFLLLEVPNLLEHEALEIAHLFAFTPSTLRETVRQAGYKTLWTKTHGSFRSPILNLYITLLAIPSNDLGEDKSFRSSPIEIKYRRIWGKFKRRVLTRVLPDWTWQSPPSLWEE